MELHTHGGDVYRNRITHDFSINLNPLGMPEPVINWLRDSLENSLKSWERYPDSECERLTGLLAELYGTRPSQILCGNGAAELIYLLAQIKRPKKAFVTAPTFFEYERALRSVGCQVEYYNLSERTGFAPFMDELADRVTEEVDMVFFCNPNNPTGVAVSAEEVEKLAKACHQNHAFLVVDECFCEFLDSQEKYCTVPLTKRYPRMAVLRAFTKTYAMAGLRLGYGICGDEKVWDAVRAVRQPWSVSLMAQEAGAAVLAANQKAARQTYLERTRKLLREQRVVLAEGLKRLGFTVYDSRANFLLFHSAWECGEACKSRGILLRDCSNFVGLGRGYYRVCIRRQEENAYLLEQLKVILDEREGQR